MLLTILLAACTNGNGPSGDPDPLSTEVTTVVVEVDYAPDAEPYTGSYAGTGDVWDLFRVNAAALVGTDKTLDVPSTLAQMELIPDPGQPSFTSGDILALADEHRDERDDDETATYYALWLDGHFADNSGVRDGVIGVSIGDTRVIAMFKPVIEQLGLTERLRAFGEQTTLVHEFGHAIGLVNNGIPPIDDHHDADHGAHCSNDDCVMYWANEGPIELGQFVAQYVASGDVVLFGDSCLDDVAAVRE